MRTPPSRSVGFWLGAVVGVAGIGYGVADLVHQRAFTDPPGLALWFGGAGIAHDAVIGPLVVAVGWLSGKLPVAARTPVRLGLAGTVLLTAVVWPLVQGWGRSAALPSALPLHYGRNLLGVLVAFWALVAFATTVRVRRR